MRARRCGVAVFPIILTLAAGGCGGEGEVRSAHEAVWDSAGVRIAESTGSLDAWTTGRPLLRIGVTEGESAEELYRVRSPLLLPSGEIVLGNAGTSEVRVYGSGGELRRAYGAEGDGPGEFRAVAWIRPYRGDSLAVWDGLLRRLTMLDPATGGARVLPLRTDDAALAADVLPDGSVVAELGEVSAGPGDTTSVLRARRPYARFDAEGRRVATLAVLPNDEHFVWAEGGSRSVRPRAFGRSTFVRASAEGDAVLVADNRGFEIRVLDPSGTHLETWRRRVEARPVTEEDRQRWTDAELEALGEGFLRRVSERAIRAMDFPEAMPFHGELLPSTDGGAWLGSYSPPHAGGPSTWTVFGADGRAVAVVTLPPGFRPTWTDSERVLGVEVDDLGVERVLLLPLLR